MNGYQLTPDAEADLEAIWNYSEQNWSADKADTYLNGLISQFEQLVKTPNMGRAYPVINTDLRILNIQSHLILYVQKSETILIVRILSGRQNWVTLLTRLD